MQQLTKHLTALRRFGVLRKVWQRRVLRTDRHHHTPAAIEGRQLRLGVGGAVFLAVVLVITGAIYLLPLGHATYTADLTEAQSVTLGNDVRVAGISVGKVTGLELRPGRVRLTFTVTRDVFVGDQSTLDVRMLTLVGGHYLALTPAGSAPLGGKTIPADRVRLPYSLMQTMQDAATPVSEVDGDTLRANLTTMQTALSRSPDALRDLGRAMQSIVTILDKQNSDISRALTVTDEFLTAINQTKSLLGTFIRKLGLIEVATLNKKAEITEALRVTAEVAARLAAVEPSWSEAIQPVLHQLTLAGPQLRQLLDKFDQSVGIVQDLRNRLQGAVSTENGVSVDQSGITVGALTVCVPVPGRGC